MWEVAWAHPKFGTLLASCSYDRQVIIWEESPPGVWRDVFVHKAHTSSVNGISWGPHELGIPVLACASSDQHVSIVGRVGGHWRALAHIKDSPTGVLAVSWAPFSHIGAETRAGPRLRLVTAGADGCARVHGILAGTLTGESASAAEVASEPVKLDHGSVAWVRDAAWAPSAGLPLNQLATCTEDGRVVVWEQTSADGAWSPREVAHFSSPVWRVSWSVTGGILAASVGSVTGEASVRLYKQALTDEWEEVADPAAISPPELAAGAM